MKSADKRSCPSWYAENILPLYHVNSEPYVSPLTITASGNSRWNKGFKVSRSTSSVSGIEFVKAGNAFFEQDGKRYKVGPGEIFILRLGGSHTYGTGEQGWLLKRYLTFGGSAIQQAMQICGIANCNRVKVRSPKRIENYLKEAQYLLTECPPYFGVRLAGIAYEICNEIGQSIRSKLPDPVREAVEYIHNNLNRSLRAEEIYRHVGLGRSQCNALFTKHADCSPLQYHTRQRMAWASHLLYQTEMSIKEISATIGYDDPLYFSSQFKIHAGMSPKKFRKRNAGQVASDWVFDNIS